MSAQALKWVFAVFWAVWLLMLVVADPIASWLGTRYHVGDEFTDTHFLVTWIPYGMRVGVLAWLVYHFLFEHKRS